jgi:hypothetical protein
MKIQYKINSLKFQLDPMFGGTEINFALLQEQKAIN